MSQRFGERYLRYVDDIIIICEPTEAEDAKAYLAGLLKKEGLELNQDKTDVVGADSWRLHCPGIQADDLKLRFDELTSRIVHFFLAKPGQGDELEAALLAEGFTMPLSRFRSLSRSARYRFYVRLDRLFSWLFPRFYDPSDTVSGIVTFAKALRGRFQGELEAAREAPIAEAPMRRRWQVQKWRRIVNRLMYLLPISDYPQLLASIPKIDELAEPRIVLGAAISGDCTELLKLPGKAVSAFAQLWHVGGKGVPAIRWEEVKFDRATGSAFCDLALMTLGAVPNTLSYGLYQAGLPGTAFLTEVCRSIRPRGVQREQSYLDEAALLFAGRDAHEVRELFYSRHDENEELGLDALGLAGDYSGVRALEDIYS